MRKLIAPLAMTVILVSGPVWSEDVDQGEARATIDFYGHLNFAGVSVDDGIATRTYVANNSNSTSRIGLNIDQPLGVTHFRFNFETDLGLPSTSNFDNDPATANPDYRWTRENLRKVDVIVRHEQWGTISFGQGSMASDGAAEVDLSGVGNTYVGIADTAGGFEFRRIGTDMLSGVSIGDAFKAFDGNGRKGRVRYDTPTIAGFTVSASWGKEVLKRNRDEEFRDVALWYANEFPNGAELEAKLAWFQEDKSGTKSSGVAGSASLFLPSGLNFTIAAADKGAPSYIYGKIGYTRMFWEVGSTSFAVDYYHGKDYALMGGATTSNSKAWGAGVTQKFDEYNLEGYLSYRHHSFEDNMASYHEIDTVIAGSRWKF